MNFTNDVSKSSAAFGIIVSGTVVPHPVPEVLLMIGPSKQLDPLG